MSTAYFHADDTVVTAPAAQVYALLLAVRRYGEWWRRVRCEPLGPEGTLRLGSRFRLSGGPLSWVVEVTGLIAERRIDLAYVDGDLLGPVRWELTPQDGATRVRYAYRGVRPNSPYTEQSFASGRSLRLHAESMRDDAFAGIRRVLESPAADASGGDLFEALQTQRAVRHFRPDPIPTSVLRHILAAALRAPSARNAQPWTWLAVRDAALKHAIGARYLAAWRRAQAFTVGADADADIKQRPDYAGMMRAVDHLAVHLGDAPVLILCALDTTQLGPMADADGTILAPQSAYASIFPAVQNLMLAARGLGIGSTLTTLIGSVEAEVREIVAMPPYLHIAALVPLGYPRRSFGTTNRKRLDEVAFGDRWGQALED